MTPPTENDLIERSGELKRRLIAFATGRRYRRVLDALMFEHADILLAGDEGDVVNLLDRFALQHRLADGRRVVEQFVEKQKGLAPEERDMLLGWRDVVEGIFAIVRREGDTLLLHNLVDELTYPTRSNAGPAAMSAFPAKAFLIDRLVPLGDGWLLSGAQRLVPRGARGEAERFAADLVARAPHLVFRNPERLKDGWRFQREDRQRFVAFFQTDTVVLRGDELAARMRAYMRFSLHEWRDDAGETLAALAGIEGDEVPASLEMTLPDDLTAAETVGVIYDETDGMHFFPDFGLVAEAFARPELAADRRHREAVLDYLKDPDLVPLPLRRLAEADPERADRLLAAVLRQPGFSWARDGEALLRRYKPRAFEEPVLPGVVPMGEAVARAQRREAGDRRHPPRRGGGGTKRGRRA